MKSYEQLLQDNWEKYSPKYKIERQAYSEDEIVYQGRKLYNKFNPPFIATVIKVSKLLWEKLQQIQADFDIIDHRQIYFHPNYFHITLNEFGWADQVDLDDVVAKLEKYCKEISPFEVKIRGINCFDRIIFAQVFDQTNSLESLNCKTYELFPNLEKVFPDYIPHISLVKIDTTEALDIIQKISENFRTISIGRMYINEVHLVSARPYLSVGRIVTIKSIPLGC